MLARGRAPTMNRVAFTEWAEKESLIVGMPLHFLKGRKIGVDASYFLSNLGPEGVLSALGGSPLSLGARITTTVKNLQHAGLELHFVFNGLDDGQRSDPFAVAAASARSVDEGFSLYDATSTDEANTSFKKAGPSNPAILTRTFQKTLWELGVDFTVAPYSALAQLAYYEKHESPYVDAVYGPPELFCFGANKVITRFETDGFIREKEEVNDSEQLFYWIDKRPCLERLGNIPTHLFVDALLISGSTQRLATFPPLSNSAAYKSKSIIRDAVDTIAGGGGSVPRLCAQSNDSALKEYGDHYKRAIASMRHHIVMTAASSNQTGDDLVAPLDKGNAPSDLHDVIGLRLPEELYHYLSRGMIQPQILNTLTSGTCSVTMPPAGSDSDSYRSLVQSQLDPIRRQAVSLLAEPLNRYFQVKEITTRLWYDRDSENKFNSKNVQPSPRETLSKWHVNDSLLQEVPNKNSEPGSLSFAVQSLGVPGFAKKTLTPKAKNSTEFLNSPAEILSNAIWRFLQLRGYVDEKHQLTHWGKVLGVVLSISGGTRESEEAALLAVELMRFDLINPDTMFKNYSGAPVNGSVIDKRNCMLISRIACLGKIKHQAKPYSGPLSRHLLAYQSIISSVRNALRDLIEMILAAMFLEGSIQRDRTDWMDLSIRLPLYEEHSCALGNLTLHYLDELSAREDPTAENNRSKIKEMGQKLWIIKSNFSESLEDAFRLWDAVYQGVKVDGEGTKDLAMWDEVNQWLSKRR